MNRHVSRLRHRNTVGRPLAGRRGNPAATARLSDNKAATARAESLAKYRRKRAASNLERVVFLKGIVSQLEMLGSSKERSKNLSDLARNISFSGAMISFLIALKISVSNSFDGVEVTSNSAAGLAIVGVSLGVFGLIQQIRSVLFGYELGRIDAEKLHYDFSLESAMEQTFSKAFD